MKALIISSGDIKNYKLLKSTVEENDYIVCADGGVNHLLKIDKLPNVVLGDLDSIEEKSLKILVEEEILIEKFPIMKDETDTELCINYLLEKGFKDITLIGVTGTRLDHTLGNIFLLKKIYKTGSNGLIVNENNRIFYTEDIIRIKKIKNRFVSLILINESGIVVSLDGFLYPLKKESLEFASTRGISNEIIEEYGSIKIWKGGALVIESKD